MKFYSAGLLSSVVYSAILGLVLNDPVNAQTEMPAQYADTIIVNGEIYTVDNTSLTAEIGTVIEAIAIKYGRVQAVGTNEQMRMLSGPGTRVIDVEGRTVIPGIIDTHSHLDSYGVGRWGAEMIDGVPLAMVPQPDFDFRWGVNWDEGWEFLIKSAREYLRKEVAEAEPGEWIAFGLSGTGVCRAGVNQIRFTRQNLMLDEIAPDNPVHVECGPHAVTNTLAEERYRNIWGDRPMEPGMIDRLGDGTGLGSNSLNRILVADILATPEEMVNIMKLEMEAWASFGSTTWSSSIRAASSLAALKILDHKGLSPNRVAWGPSMGSLATGTQEMNLNLPGYGTEWVWYNGVSLRGVDSGFPGHYSSLEPPEIPQDIKNREFRSPTADLVPEIIAAGHRYTNTHTAGDASLDETMDVIERESARIGMTLEDIRAMRHVVDHCTMNPRPDQIPRLNKLGMHISCSPKRIPDLPPNIARDYGEQYTKWISPMRSLIDGGVMPSIELDTSDVHNKGYFFYLDMFVNRVSRDGRVYNPEERIEREHALKAATIWAAYYVLREDRIGSLEPGKLADFVVLDKPYFNESAVPNEQIKTVRPLMTVVGDRISYLDTDLAVELGMEPVGSQPKGVIEAIDEWEKSGWP